MILCRVFLEWLPAIGQYSANKIYFSLRWRKSESLNSKGEKFILSAKDNSFCGDKNPTHLGYFYLKKFWLTWLTGWLITWVLQKSSSLIGQLATIHICDWLTKVKQIYESSFLLVHDCDSLQLRTIALSFNFESSYEFYENIFSSK